MSLNQGKNEKNYCPPGSYSRYLQVKKVQASKGQQSVDAELESLEAELLRSSEGLRQPRSSGDVYENDFAEDASNNQNEEASEPDVIVENANSVTQKKVRGRTILQEIHNRDLEDRDPIILNDRHQPVGPKDIVKTFKNFLGTVAKDANLAPLNYISWNYVPDKTKDNIWEYIQEISRKNKENRKKQCDMHTMGSTSYAILRHDLQENDPNKREPLLADIYMESRKRKVGHTYLTSSDETLQNIEKMKALKAQGDGSETSDPYYDVIAKKEHSGRLRLHG